MGFRHLNICLCFFYIFLLGCSNDPAANKTSTPWIGRCSKVLSRAALEESLKLGSSFLVANQLPAGNFEYEYDWKSKHSSKDDNQVRQAGALWGLALLYFHSPSKELVAALESGFNFFEKNSRLSDHGARYVVYPGDGVGKTGTVALIALAYIDYLRAAAPTLPASKMASHRQAMDGYLSMLLKLQRSDGLWYGGYSLKNGAPEGAPSSYSDGEALLALIKAAKYFGRSDLKEPIILGAKAGTRANIDQALKVDPDSPITKGYYQWSSMAFFELSRTNWDGVAEYADRLLQLSDWMIDVHKTLNRTKNTAYAYEGLIHAYVIATERKDARAEKLACVIEQGLEKLTSWQIGHSIGNDFVKTAKTDDLKALGGVQNSADESALRIDVAQHQMHAVNLALKYYY